MTLLALVFLGSAQAQVVPFYTMPADNTRVEKRPCPNCHESPLPPPKADDWSWAAKPQPCPSHHKTAERPFDFNKFGYYTAPADNTRVAIPYRPLPAAVVPEKKEAPAKAPVKKEEPKKPAPVKKPVPVSKPKPVPAAKEQAQETKESGAAFDGGQSSGKPQESVAPVVVPNAEGMVQDYLEGKTYPKPALSSVKTDTQLREPASPKPAAAEAKQKKPWAKEWKAAGIMGGVGAVWGVALGAVVGGPLAIVGFALLGAVMFGALGWAATKKK